VSVGFNVAFYKKKKSREQEKEGEVFIRSDTKTFPHQASSMMSVVKGTILCVSAS
jgi:hypothetical protein